MSKAPRIGLWANDRGPMASGNSGGIRFVLWRNDKKEPGSRQPDFHLVLEAPERREDTRQQDQPSGGPVGADLDDDLPF